MSDETFIDMIRNEHALAIKKHPLFAHSVFNISELITSFDNIRLSRMKLENEIENGVVSSATVFMCEFSEFREAYADGDYDHALVELAQCGAVIMRMMEMVKAESEGDK